MLKGDVMADLSNDDFFRTLSVFTDFEGVTDSNNYQPLPDDWLLAVADIVSSTKAIESWIRRLALRRAWESFHSTEGSWAWSELSTSAAMSRGPPPPS